MKYFAYLFIIFVIYIILSASLGWYNPFFVIVNKIPFGDKLMHIILLGTFAFCVNVLLRFRTFQISKYQLLTGSVIMFLLATLEEISQYWIPTRTFDLLDLTANYIGILLASFFILKYQKRIE